MQTSLFQNDLHDFTLHVREHTQEGENQVQQNKVHFTGQCFKLLQYWQKHNYWLTSAQISEISGSSYPPIRLLEMKRNGIAIDWKWDKTKVPQVKRWQLKCTCHLIGGVKESQGCYVHCEELKLK